MKEPNPLFIIGCPRSGTTMLARWLAPSTYGAPIETHFIVKYYMKLKRYGDLKVKKNFTRLIRDILNERPVMQWNLDFDIEQFWNEVEQFEYNEIVSKLCKKKFEILGKSRWGDKTPHYLLNLKVIYELFPRAKFIFIIRDGRDVALSLMKRPWGPNNIYSCARYWKKYNSENVIFQILERDNQILKLRYEDLLRDPLKKAMRIYDFLEEPFREEEIVPIIKTVRKNNFNKWKREMKIEKIRLFENVASNTLRQFNYETSFPEEPVNPIKRYFWEVHDIFYRFRYLIKANTIDFIRIKFFGMSPFAD